MSDSTDTRADITRQQILLAAARQFARRSYNTVNLDDILADANVTKGAMYFHFQSKHALALAIIEHYAAAIRASTMELLTRQLSGLETMIDITFMVAAQDVGDDYARAAMNLIDAVGRPDRISLLDEWIKGSTTVLEQAISEGDVLSDQDPADLARWLIAVFVGIRQISDLNDPKDFFTSLQHSWSRALPGFANPDRIDYLQQFIKRRTTVAIRNIGTAP